MMSMETVEVEPTVEVSEADDFARDSLHLLPLNILPIRTPGLRRARLMKNHQLRTVIELFCDNASGSGQVDPARLPALYQGYEEEVNADLGMFNRLATIPSFDVYTLRLELRRLDIPVEDHEALRLSQRKRVELAERLSSFTRPLIDHVYGKDSMLDEKNPDVVEMIKKPNQEDALTNLKIMAEKLNVQLNEIPRFLEEYGDIFLSLAYFRNILDTVVPDIHAFLVWMDEARDAWLLRANRPLMRSLDEVASQMTEITGSLTGRFESFDQRTIDFWQDISAERFHRIRELIVSHHTTIGGVLCGLVLKMDLFQKRFFGRVPAGPARRIEFIRSEIMPGLQWMADLERSAAKVERNALRRSVA